VAGAALVYQDGRARPGYTWYELPGFDPHVYAAMAESPSYFTVAPWGYRLLTPWVVQQFRPRDRLEAFRVVTLASFWLAAGLLFLFLRRLGHGEPASLAAVAAFALSSPVLVAVRMPVMVDPLALLLLVAFLLAVERGADIAVCAALLALGVLSKELTLLLPPLVFLARWRREGPLRALLSTLLAVAPAAALLAWQRWVWTPQIRPPEARWSLSVVRHTLEVMGAEWPDVWRRSLLGGLLPLALLGALRVRARPFLRRYGYLAGATLVLPFLAWTNVPSLSRSPHIGDNLPRLLLFALPLLLPLALLALDRVWPHVGAVSPPAATRPATRAAALLALAVTLLFVFVGLDRYRREPLHETRDGLLVRALCRESLGVARRLGRGEAVTLDPERSAFDWRAGGDASDLYRMRWYLREGWGPVPQYGTGDVVMHDSQATVLLPVLVPSDLALSLVLGSPRALLLDVAVGDRYLETIEVPVGGRRATLRVPANALFRGDNHLVLRQRDNDAVPLRLRRIELEPLPGS